MRYGSVCSGIEAATIAWEPLGWQAAWFAEVDPFCTAVLESRWLEVPNLGDVTSEDFVERARDLGPIDVLVGGTPCQSFSTSGLRKGFNDDRGNLTLRFLEIAGELRPPYLLWENVPGVLSQDGGRSFGTILGKVAELGYRWAYRVLDAQHFGIAQRRRRVYLVGCLGDRCPSEVLFEQEGEGRHPEKGGEEGEEAAGTPREGAQGVVYSFYHHSGLDQKPQENVAPPLTVGSKTGANAPAVAYSIFCEPGGEASYVVRRLTPRECERLQGFPDDHTLVPFKKRLAPDGRRYRATGNSMATFVMRWIGRRLQAFAEKGK